MEKTEEKIPEKAKTGARNLVIGIVIVIIILGAWMFSSYKESKFSYNGITGNVVKEGALTLYQISIPVVYQGEKQPYYFYLRNNPENLAMVPFNGEIDLRGKIRDMVINSTGNLTCEGKGVIGVMNLADLYNILGSNVIKNETLGCPANGEYMFLQLKEGNETKITQFGPSCYYLEVANCETLKATEKFMVETLIKIKEDIL
ncbi:MAG: hypothetical protein AABW50_00815 [Nanoarchaeota archaeon]